MCAENAVSICEVFGVIIPIRHEKEEEEEGVNHREGGLSRRE
jgi:hypothetical protein